MNETTKTVRAMIGGRVQGVGYRAWVRAEAEARGIAGWVRNCSSGDVEAIFEGSAEAVDALCAACWRGPSQARVDRVEVREAGGDVSSGRFEVRY